MTSENGTILIISVWDEEKNTYYFNIFWEKLLMNCLKISF